VKTFPIHLKIEGLKILLVGGGTLALEKLDKLVQYEADVTVVSPHLSPDVAAIVEAHGVSHLAEPYRRDHIGTHRIVYAAADEATNARIYDDTRSIPILLNTVDAPDFCDFIMPSVVQGAHFTLSVSTGGKAAGLSKQMREQLERYLAKEDDVLTLLDKIRDIFKRKYATFNERRDRLREILEELERIEKGGGDSSSNIEH